MGERPMCEQTMMTKARVLNEGTKMTISIYLLDPKEGPSAVSAIGCGLEELSECLQTSREENDLNKEPNVKYVLCKEMTHLQSLQPLG